MTDMTCGIFDDDKIETSYGKWLTPKWLRQSLGKQYKMFILLTTHARKLKVKDIFITNNESLLLILKSK